MSLILALVIPTATSLFLFFTFFPIVTLVIPTYNCHITPAFSSFLFVSHLHPSNPYLTTATSLLCFTFSSSLILTLVIPTYNCHITPLLSLLLILALIIPTYSYPLHFLLVTNPHPSNPDLPRYSFPFLSTFSLCLILTLVIPTYHATPFHLSLPFLCV